jgi:sodium-dependent dicarboxylate transporter 2/3/5
VVNHGLKGLTGERAAKLAASSLAVVIFLWLAVSSSMQGKVLGVVLLALVFWGLFPNHYLVSSISIIALLSLLEAATSPIEFINSLFSTYGESGLWIIISGFILSTAMEVSGLGRKIAFWIATALGGDPKKVILAIALANFAISPLSPSTSAKAFLMLPICTGLIEAFDVQKGSRYGTSVMIMSMAANNICSTAFLTATVPNPISADYIRNATSIALGYVDWLRMALPITLILLVASWVICTIMFRPEVRKSQETIEHIGELRKRLGPLNMQEKAVAIIFSAALLLWIFERQIRIDIGPIVLNGGLISLFISLLIFHPRIEVMKFRGFTGRVPWGTILLFAASMFLANAVRRWRALDPVALSVFRLLDLSQLSVLVFVSLVVVLSMFLHLIFTSTTVYATVMVPLMISFANLQGLPPQLIAIPVAFLAPLALILPINTIPNIIFYSSGYFTQRQIIKYGIAMSIVSVVVILLVGLPLWKYEGLIQF